MKNNILDVLMYLYDNFFCDLQQTSQEISAAELEQIGFLPSEIDKTFAWLEELASQKTDYESVATPKHQSIRIYSDDENEKINAECRGFLQFLEHGHMIDPEIREIIILQVMELDCEEFSIEQFVRIILIVLMTRQEQEATITWLELYLEKNNNPAYVE